MPAAGTIPAAVALPDPDRRRRDAPDDTCLWQGADGHVVACASLWWRATASLDGRRTGCIGHLAAGDAGAAHAILDQACARLRAAGCAMALAPMDGDTWHRYRTVTDRGDRPRFVLEPWDDGGVGADVLTAAGFTPVARYVSTLVEDLTAADPRLPAVAGRLRAAGVTVRPFDPTRTDEDLARLHALSLIAFRGNILYTPLWADRFAELYRPILPLLEPELVLMAECAGETVGYAFALPDHAQAERGRPVDTVVLKTVAVRPGRAWRGLGAWLAAEIHRRAAAAGCRAVIHALMHEGNRSAAWSRRFGRVIRRYALFARALT